MLFRSDLDQRASVRDQFYGLLDIDANPKPVYFACASSRKNCRASEASG